MMSGDGPRSRGHVPVRQALTIAAASGALAVAVWLLPASVHVASWPRSGPHRIAVLAPLVRLWLLLAGAAAITTLAIAQGRRSPAALGRAAHIVAPLMWLWTWTVPYWPWLPDRLPLLMAGAGPLRWGMGALAVAGVAARAARVTSLASRAGAWLRPLQRPSPRLVVFCVALTLYAALGIVAFTSTGLGGDEPHYLVMTQSLIADGDLAIENNHANGDYRRFFNGELRPDYLRRGADGVIYSIHAPGLSVWLIPGYLLARELGAVLTMCVLAALASTAVYEIGCLMAGSLAGWLTWAVVGLTVPFIPHAWAMYPEMAGAAIMGWCVVWLLEDRQAFAGMWAWRGCCVAWLPWLHTKFSVLLAGAVLCLVWRLRREPRLVASLVLPIGVSVVAWLAFFYVIYGVWDPQAPYGGYTAQFVRLENIPRSLLGLLFDQKFGLLVYAPIYALAVPGLVSALRDRRWRAPALAAATVAVAYITSSARLYMWWGGSSAPARFLVPVVPLVAPLIALGVDRVLIASRDRRPASAATWVVIAAVSGLVALGGAIGAERLLLFSEPHGVARLLALTQGSAPLTATLPTFTQEAWTEPLRLLLPWLVALGLALFVGRLCARHRWNGIERVGAQLLAFTMTVALLTPSFPARVRADSEARGDMELIERFDPVRLRAFDYARMQHLLPPEWLSTLTMNLDREPGALPDPQGRITGALALPAGVYEVRVWFDGGARPRAGMLQAALGNGYLLSRVEEPLPNPAVLPLSLPVSVPTLWIQLTDQAAARMVRRVEVHARDVVPEGDRPRPAIRVVESIPERLGAYVGFAGHDAYPEGGAFWTRADARAHVWLAPAGASTLVATLHVGPKPTTVSIQVGEWQDELALGAEETRSVRIPLVPGISRVPIDVRARDFFVPAEVDRRSADTRQLGCQVRFVLE